jgi:hypothetical protein
VPVLTSFLAAHEGSSGRRPSSLRPSGTGLPSRITAVLTGAPVPFPRRLSARPAFRSLRARLRHEVPGFGADLIARPAGIVDRGMAFPRIAARVPEPAAGGEEAVALGCLLAAKRWIDVTSSVVCSIVKGRSPHSVPSHSPSGWILGGAVRVQSPFGPSFVAPRAWGKRDPRHGTRIPVADACAAAGTRSELGGNPSVTCPAAHEAAGQAVPHFDCCGSPFSQSGSESGPSPIQRRRRPPSVTP